MCSSDLHRVRRFGARKHRHGRGAPGAGHRLPQGKGVQFHQWPQEILDAYRAAWDEVVAEEAAKDADFARAWESLKAFRESYSTWKELGYLK